METGGGVLGLVGEGGDMDDGLILLEIFVVCAGGFGGR